MKPASNINKTALLAVLLFLIPVSPLFAKTKANKAAENAFDFAYPKTVMEKSDRAMKLSISRNEPVKTLENLIALSVARNLISSDDALNHASLFDSVANLMPSEYKSVALLLEASFYNDVYLNKPSFNRASVNNQDSTLNPTYWDYSMFSSRILSLVKKALEASEPTKRMPLSDLKPIVSLQFNTDVYPVDYSDFFVYDFIVYKSLELINGFQKEKKIPFFPDRDGVGFDRLSLIDSVISCYDSPSLGLAFALTKKLNVLPDSESEEYYKSLISQYSGTVCSIPLIAWYYGKYSPKENDISQKRELYNLVDKELGLLSSNPSASVLQNIKKSLLREYVRVTCNETFISNRDYFLKVDDSNLRNFNLLVYKSEGKEPVSPKIKNIDSYASKILTLPVNYSDVLPFFKSDSIKINIKSPGKYYVVVSSNEKASGAIGGTEVSPYSFMVTDIDIIQYYDNLTGNIGCFVVDAATSSPLPGVDVGFEEIVDYYNKSGARKANVKTDAKGFALSPFLKAKISVDSSKGSASFSLFGYDFDKEKPFDSAVVITDLPIYHPGDTVRFVSVFTHNESNRGSLISGREVKISLFNANHVEIDSLCLTTDVSGRVFGEFTLPTDGLRGEFSIRAGNLSSGFFRVEDYRLPAFFITLEKKSANEDSAEFQGVVSTYSGMPLANVKLSYDVSWNPYYRYIFNRSMPLSFTSDVTTDSEGKFKIQLPLSDLPKEYFHGLFRIRASAFDDAGAFVESASVPFFLTNSYSINPAFPSLYEAKEDSLSFKVSVTNQLDLPEPMLVDYTVKNQAGMTVAEGNFNSPVLLLPSSALPSGKYWFSFSLSDDPETKASAETVIYRKGESAPPAFTPLWVPVSEYISDSRKPVEIEFGSSLPSHKFLCIVSDSKGAVKTDWLTLDNQNLTLKVDAPLNDEVRYVNIITYYNHNYYSKLIVLKPESQTLEFKISKKSFRDRIWAGNKESWKFKITLGGKPVAGFVIASLYDKALEYFGTPYWQKPTLSTSYPLYYRGASIYLPHLNFTSSVNQKIGSIASIYGSMGFNTFGYDLYGERFKIVKLSRDTRSAGNVLTENLQMNMAAADYGAMATMKSAPTMNSMALEESAVEADDSEAAVESPAVVIEEGSDARESVEFRPAEMPLAFFKPDLVADSDGSISIDFTVPNFNTTWKLLLEAYTSDLHSSVTSFETVAAKSVMIRMQNPAFLRTGDHIMLNSTVFNNSDECKSVSSAVEIFDVLTGSVICRKDFDIEPIEAMGNRVISMEFTTPDNLNCIGIRAYAISSDDSDGEQAVIPVLPSSSPVIDSYPFYLEPSQREFSMEIPSQPDNANITLTYCDNPAWEVLTALSPIIKPDSETLFPNIDALYANALGLSILQKHPGMREGLQLIVKGEAGDSMLVSNLSKNQNLKYFTLDNTPWVNSASSETLKMQSLSSLLEESEALQAINTIWDKIISLQNPDGGWCWHKGMKSSLWLTQSILRKLAMLNQNASVSLNDFSKVTSSAIAFCEREILDDYNRSKKKNYNYESLLPYLYIRSFFSDVKWRADFLPLRNKALAALEKNWKEYSVHDKALIAMLLHRENRNREVAGILLSLKQFASYSPEKGMWFDNLSSSWNGAGKLQTTATVLNAFEAIAPADPDIDRIRQWLILQRQVQDWQESLCAVEVINAICNSGTDWNRDFGKPEIRIGDKLVPVDQIFSLTGSCTFTVDTVDSANNLLLINRTSESPAWGGVISQYIAPISEITSHGSPYLSITKKIWRLSANDNKTEAVDFTDLNVGDRIRIALFIETDRDMDYVAVTDERGAFALPLDQISEYTSVNGIWCYREVRNSSTQWFIPFLPKGKNYIYYDCAVTEAGEFANGIAAAQSLYAPSITAHSQGQSITVNPQ